MPKTLILTEKPSLGKKVAAALGIKKKNKNNNFEENDIIIASLVGHVIEAKYPKNSWSLANLPLKFDNIKMVPSKGKKDLVNNIKKEVSRKDVTEIVNCGDADAEGSLLVYELLEYFKLVKTSSKFETIDKTKTFTRMWVLAEDKKTIKSAYDNRFSQEKDMKFVNTAKSRGEADVQIGFNFSQLYTLKKGEFGKTLNIGRVMTPTLNIVRTRELEIEAFIPEEFWNVKGSFENKESVKISSDCFVLNDENKQTTALKKEKYEGVKPLIKKGDEYVVDNTSSKLNTKKPDYLPNLNDILKAMGRMHKMSSKKTTEVMQKLYESQFCTYPRSEIKHLPVSMKEDIQKTLDTYEGLYKTELNGEPVKLNINNKRVFDDTKVESHFAIIPMIKTQTQIDKLSPEETNVFKYIVSKFLMVFMPDYKYDSSIIILKKGEVSFKTTGQIEKQKGFKAFDCISNRSQKGDVVLPDLKKGDTLILKDVKTKKDATKPPATLTEPTLLEIMGDVHKLYKKQAEEGIEEGEEVQLEHDGNFSLGTSATRSGILEKLFNIKFLEKKGQKIFTSDLGKELLVTAAGAIDISMTAKFEEEMANITADKREPETFIQNIKDYVSEIIEKERPHIKQQSTSEKKETDLKCPLCSSMLTENHRGYRCSASGKFDSKKKKFEGCGFGIIKFQKPINYTLTKEDVERLLSNETILVKENKIELDISSPFFTKITYPNRSSSYEDLGLNCPKCNGDIIQSPKLYRCKNTGKWNPKKKAWDGKCDFTQFKFIKSLGREIDAKDLGDLIAGKEIQNDEKKYKLK